VSGEPEDPKTEEGLTGADLLVVLRRVTQTLSTCAGFIAQAKVSTKLRTAHEWSRFIKQAATMEKFVPGLGYGVVYSSISHVSRATLIAGLPDPGVGTLLPASVVWRQHFREFFAGRIGDKRACELLRTGFVANRRQEFGLTDLTQGRPLVAIDLLMTDGSSQALRDDWFGSSHAPDLEEVSAEPPDLPTRG
jgi:hypothetical protein